MWMWAFGFFDGRLDLSQKCKQLKILLQRSNLLLVLRLARCACVFAKYRGTGFAGPPVLPPERGCPSHTQWAWLGVHPNSLR
jgi:hypothetical protein